MLVLLPIISLVCCILLSADKTAFLNSPFTIKFSSFFCKTAFKPDRDFAFRQYGAGGGLTGFPLEFLISYC
uniref:Putative secreted protein n=1 Tax=Ixodes ricinus TaxID=34613 RepID=A0A6B0U9E8_IXORI